MSVPVIHVNGLGKLYRIGERQAYEGLRHVLDRAVMAPFRMFRPLFNGSQSPDPSTQHPSHIWALKDVSFDVHQGEVMGIIGRNGAGKSTLLKILARVAKPTTGFAEVHGRLGSLLEVGTGFHPELTGRENIFLNGAILGMKKVEIARKFDEIVAFSEIGKFIDTPVKHYSSGMHVRLAFSVAAHLEPDILLVDEVLAVGDTDFQKKCLGKMGEVAKEGRTILFISHSMEAIARLCKRGILLSAGGVEKIGPISEVIDHYLYRPGDSPENVDVTNHKQRGGTGEVRFLEACLRDSTGNPSRRFEFGDDLCFEMVLAPRSPSPPLHCNVAIYTALGVPVLHLSSQDDLTCPPLVVKTRTRVRCVLRGCDLYPGTYSVNLWIGPSDTHGTDWVPDVLQFHMGQGQLRRRGYDITWAHGLVHRDSSWCLDECPGALASLPPVTRSAG
jgi:lipopolysaccharide transport system ATP-binding protein